MLGSFSEPVMSEVNHKITRSEKGYSQVPAEANAEGDHICEAQSGLL